MDSSTLLRRTPAGDSEVAAPANGLSITQRRILTLLDTPARFGDLPLGRALDDDRLRREVLRLAQAGLLACEMQVVTAAGPDATRSAAVLKRSTTGLTRRLSVILMAVAAVPLVWIGWQSSANPEVSIARGTQAGATHKAVSKAAASTAVPEPRVIATRVLRDPAAARPPPPISKPVADTTVPATGVRAAEPHSETEPPGVRE